MTHARRADRDAEHVIAPGAIRARRADRTRRMRLALVASWFIAAIGIGGMVSAEAKAQDVSRQEMKGLDQQLQEVKTDVLEIAAELAQLEETLLFPSDTQVALFVSLGDGEAFRLDTVEILLDGEPVARHLYSFQELEALRKGGVQRIYTGNLRTGTHRLEASFTGKRADGTDFTGRETLEFEKRVGPEIVEISLAERSGNAEIHLTASLAGR